MEKNKDKETEFEASYQFYFRLIITCRHLEKEINQNIKWYLSGSQDKYIQALRAEHHSNINYKDASKV